MKKYLHSLRVGLIIGATIFALLLSQTLLFDGFEKQTYDALMRWRGDRPVHPDIVFVFIGNDATEALGEWPITRDFYVVFLEAMKTAGAKMIVFDLLMSDPSPYPLYDQQLAAYTQEMKNVYFPYFFQKEGLYPHSKNKTIENKDILEKLAFDIPPSNHFYEGHDIILPMPALIENAHGAGHVNIVPDFDGVIREIPLFINYENKSYPSLALTAALGFMEQNWHTVNIPMNNEGMLKINYCGELNTFPNYSFLQILGSYKQYLDDEKPLIPLETFHDKLVFVGMTATGATDLNPTPFSPNYPLVGTLTNVTNSILLNDYITTVPYELELVLILLLGFGFIYGLCVRREVMIILIPFFVLILFWIIAWASFKFFNLSWDTILMTNGISLNAIAFWIWTIRRVQVEKREAQQKLLKYTEELLLNEQRQKELEHEFKELEETVIFLRKNKQENEAYQELLEKTEAERLKLLHERDQLLDDKEKLENERVILQDKVKKTSSTIRQLHSKTNETRKRAELRGNYDDIVGHSSEIIDILHKLDKIVLTDASVLLFGESGTGKELIARAIHTNSQRQDGAYVAVNCAAIPHDLIESELFGHEKGSFTGAVARRIGKFELAHDGTIFLDEIGDMDHATQAKLLRVLQEKEITRVGGTETIDVDVRIIAATNKDLLEEIEKGNFREDLYHRLNVVPLYLPPLRQRKNDIPDLIAYFLQKKGYPQIQITEEVLQLLQQYCWKGNVRELNQVVERMLVLRESDTLTIVDVPANIRQFIPSESPSTKEQIKSKIEERSLKEMIEQYERKVIVTALNQNDWNKSRTAEALGIVRRSLHKKIAKYSITDDERD